MRGSVTREAPSKLLPRWLLVLYLRWLLVDHAYIEKGPVTKNRRFNFFRRSLLAFTEGSVRTFVHGKQCSLYTGRL